LPTYKDSKKNDTHKKLQCKVVWPANSIVLAGLKGCRAWPSFNTHWVWRLGMRCVHRQ